MTSIILILCSVLTALALAEDSFRTKCLDFTPEAVVFNSTRRLVEYVPAGTNLTFPNNDASCARPSQIVYADICRLALTIPTSNRSSVIFEIWLPRDTAWTGRYLATGNGGIDGCIKYEDLAYTSQYGFAATGSNNGHNGTGGLAFYHNPDVVTDYAYRSLHTNVNAGKTLTNAFYGKTYTKSYFLGCSQGGRQGFHSAEIYPDDFDGIVAGCPALNFNYMSAWRGNFYVITGAANGSNFITPTTWTGLIHDEVLKQCDLLDGVSDSIIEDVDLCQFRPEALLCEEGVSRGNASSPTCLTVEQVEIVRQVYSPLYGQQGQLLYPGLQPGAESAAVKTGGILSGASFLSAADWFRYVVYQNPSWNPSSLTIASATAAESLNPFNVRTWPSTLSSFQQSGGKLITYHGGADNQITGFNTERFYNRLSLGMNQTSSKLDDWFRFFRIPGMNHCNQGPGAWSFGQGGLAAQHVPFTAERNVLAAMVKWVEEGVPPDYVLGTNFDASGNVTVQKRHCRYPYRSTYIGGEPALPDSWVCKSVGS